MAGTKPEALRTEYAEDGSYSGSYHGDIVFYLQRADGGGGGEFGNGLEDSFNGGPFGSIPGFPGNISSGSGDNDGPSQSAWNQIAAWSDLVDFDFDFDGNDDYNGQAGSGPNYEDDDEVPPGAISENAARIEDLIASLRNIFQSVPSFDNGNISFSVGSSEHLFHKLLEKSFSPTEDTEDILGSIERGTRSDLAIRLAKATGGVTRTRDLIEGINRGKIGVTSPGFKATTVLLGENTGRPFRSLK